MQKYNINYIKQKLALENYKLLPGEYVNANKKLMLECPIGHLIKLSWHKWTQGRRCKYCNGSRIYFSDIKSRMQSEDYLLLTSELEYKNTKQKLDCKCPNNHIFKISWSNWARGIRCKQCYINKLRSSFYKIKSQIENFNYKVLTNFEDNDFTSRSLITCECTVGHFFTTTWNKWQNGYRCKVCSLRKRNDKFRLSYDFIKKSFSNEGYILLSDNYKNAFLKLKYICPNGHRHHIKWNYWQQGNRCPFCALINNVGSGHWNWQGGISFDPYCSIWKDQEFKNDIKLRDGFVCCNPLCISKNPNSLVLHHIDYDKKNCNLNNLITLCRSCNAKANFDKEWHQNYYKNILFKKYNYSFGGGF